MAVELLRAPTFTNAWVKYLQWSMWIGIAQNLVMAVPAIFFPVATLQFFAQTVPVDVTWVSAAGLTLVCLASMYVPAAWNPLEYRWTTWLSIMARFPGVLFFWFWHAHHYPLFGWIDSIMLVIQLPLWLLTLSSTSWPLSNTQPYRV